MTVTNKANIINTDRGQGRIPPFTQNTFLAHHSFSLLRLSLQGWIILKLFLTLYFIKTKESSAMMLKQIIFIAVLFASVASASILPVCAETIDGDSLMNRAFLKQIAGDNYGAIADYTRLAKIDKNWILPAYLNRGGIKGSIGDFKGAEEDFTEAIDSFKNRFPYVKNSEIFNAIKITLSDLYFNRGQARLNLKNYYEAISDYTRAIELKPENSASFLCRGIAKGNIGDTSGEITDKIHSAKLGNNKAKQWLKDNGHSW